MGIPNEMPKKFEVQNGSFLTCAPKNDDVFYFAHRNVYQFLGNDIHFPLPFLLTHSE